jgi:hypothetical protein
MLLLQPLGHLSLSELASVCENRVLANSLEKELILGCFNNSTGQTPVPPDSKMPRH